MKTKEKRVKSEKKTKSEETKSMEKFMKTAKKPVHIPTGIAEFDRVLGGGLVPGNLLVLGGEHGVGKTTLLLQACAGFASGGRKSYFASGEETQQAILATAKRVGVDDADTCLHANPEGVDVNFLFNKVIEYGAKVLVIDSLQVCWVNGVKADIGSPTMMDAAVASLLFFAERLNVAVVAICHFNKKGELAGSVAMQYRVDGILHLERRVAHDENGVVAETQGLRVIRVDKSRYVLYGVCGLLEMTDSGFREPSVEALRAYVLAVPLPSARQGPLPSSVLNVLRAVGRPPSVKRRPGPAPRPVSAPAPRTSKKPRPSLMTATKAS